MDINLKLAEDGNKRRAKIFLCVRSIKSSSSNSGESFLSSLHPGLAHWVLSIEFEDKVIYAEGVAKNGKMVPEVSTHFPDTWLSREPYGSKDLSPSQVFKLAMQHPLNYTIYNELSNNCQHWFRKMTQLLGIENSNQEPLGSGKLATLGAIGVGGAIAMGLGAWFFNRSNDQSDADSDSD